MTEHLYTVVIVGKSRPRLAAALRKEFRAAVRELRLPKEALGFRTEIDDDLLGGRKPVFCVYLAPDESPETLEKLIKIGAAELPLVPVVKTKAGLGTLPEPIKQYNGLVVETDADGAALVAAGLEWLGLLPRQRKAFISYRRKDSRRAALSLHASLAARGYEVFLDTHDVRPGEDFQAVLMHRLCDSDVVVLFDTPDFLSSRWTKEELARASLLNIALVQIIWPGHKNLDPDVLAERLYLAEADLRKDKALKARTARKIVELVERIRSRAFAYRTAGIVREFVLEAQSAGFEVVLEMPNHIVATQSSNKRIVAVPITGLPRSNDYHDVHDAIAHTSYKDAIVLFQGTGMLERWANHLTWLDSHLPVKALTVEGVQTYLSTPAK